MYQSYRWFDSCSGNVLLGYCQCKSGSGGYCKHVCTVFYSLWDMLVRGKATVPEDKSITELPAYWMQRHGSVSTSLALEDIVVKKHKAPSVGIPEREAISCHLRPPTKRKT